ncbi:MAG: ABC transporter permease subunit [Gammaproteobacteria bacterium]|jgi:arginine transport system permease protein
MEIISGVIVTIELMLVSLLIGLAAAIFMVLVYQSKSWFLKTLIDIFIFLVRGTPMLLQFFIIYYGSAQFAWLKASPLWVVFKEPFYCAVIALAINTSAYTTVLFKGVINSVPQGEKEACKVLGLSRFQTMWYVILPRALRIAMPAYSNEVIMVLKGTSLASTITVLELTGVAHQIASQTYMFVETFLLAGLIYFAMNLVIIGVFKKLEKKLAFASV